VAPEVSVVIPTRGRWGLLSRTLAGALGQEGVEHEVVVVDDGSADETGERLAALGDPRLRVVRNERPGGVAAARNRGLAEAAGEWVAFLDDDDLWSPRKLRAQLDAAGAADADFAYSAVVAVDGDLNVTRALPSPDPRDLLRRELRLNAMPAGGSNVVVSSALLRTQGGFDERLYHLADWDLWIRLAAAGRGAASPTVDVAYVEHGQNMHMSELRNTRREFVYLVDKHRGLSRDHGVDFDRLGFELWMAWADRRSGNVRRAAWLYLRSALVHRSARNLARAVWMVLPGGSKAPGGPAPPPEPDWLAAYRKRS
jgi:glycosyltransferase involved in cell wall biosynthesis